MAILGADVEQLENLARIMAKAGDVFGQSFTRIRDSLHQANWTGPSADRFKTEWITKGKNLREAHDELINLASRLRQEADQQLAASGFKGRDMEPRGGISESKVPSQAMPSQAGEFAGPSGFSTPPAGASHVHQLDVRSFITPLEANFPRLLQGTHSLNDLVPSASNLLSQLDSEIAGTGTSFDVSKDWSLHRAGDAAWGSYSIDAKAGIGADGSVTFATGIRDGQLRADLDAGLRIGAYAELSADTDVLGFAPVGVHAEAMAGANAEIAGEMTLGTDGLHGSLSGGGFAGARAGAEGEVTLGEYGDAEAGAEAWAGIGVEGSGDAQLGWDRIGFETKFGIGFGVGAKVSFDVGFSPKGLFGGISDFGRHLGKVDMNDVASVLGHTPVVGDIADGAVSAAKGAVAGAGRTVFKAVGSFL